MNIQITESEKNILSDDKDFHFTNEPYSVKITKELGGNLFELTISFTSRSEKEYFQYKIHEWK